MSFPTPPINADGSLAALLVPVASDEGSGRLLTHGRVKDVAAARSIFLKLKEEDRQSAQNRALIQGELEGVPPYDQGELVGSGLGDMTNENMGFALMFYDQAKAPYHDLLDSVDVYCTLPTTYGTEAERQDWQPIMEEEWSEMLRSWPDFNFRFNDLVGKYLYHGVAMGLFPNSQDLRWEASALGDVLVPRRTKATEGDIEVLCWADAMPPHRLYNVMEQAKIADNKAWNQRACLRALKEATAKTDSTSEPEKALESWKNNDLGAASGAAEIKCVHELVVELDGRISHYIFRETGEDGEEFLYKSIGKYPHLNNAAVMFTFGTGTNAFYHSIRGMGQRIYGLAQALNRMWCSFIDSTMNSMKEIAQAQSEGDMEEMEITQYGNMLILPPGLDYKPRQIPNYAQAIVPSLQLLQNTMGQKTAVYASEAAFNDSKERTKAEVMGHLESLARLSISTLNLFYNPWERLLREQVRRTIRKGVTVADPFGAEIMDFRNRCLKRGVPGEAIDNIHLPGVKAVRAVGHGSAAARSVAYERLMGLYDKYDTTGQRRLLRLITRAIAGNQVTDQLAPPPEVNRVPLEKRIADSQNFELEQGQPVTVYPDDTHILYVESRLGRLAYYNNALDSGEMEVAQGIPPMIYLHANAQEHLDFIPTDAKAAGYRQMLQQLGETMNNGLKQLQAEEERAAKEAAAGDVEQGMNGEGQGQAPRNTDALQRQLVESQVRLAELGIKQAKAAKDIELADEKIASIRQKRALDDAKTAVTIATASR